MKTRDFSLLFGTLVLSIYSFFMSIHVGSEFYQMKMYMTRRRKILTEHDLKETTRKGPKIRVENISCWLIMEGDEEEIKRAHKLMQTANKKPTPDEYYFNISSSCEEFLQTFDYSNFILTEEEKLFPIAYSILMYESVEQTERLLRAIYRPHNAYCVHIDVSSSDAVKKAMASLVRCFHNVFLVSRPVDVIYNHFSRLEADMNCMEDLLHHDINWKYFINLPNTEFPLKSNGEIVKILKIYNGSNDIEGITNPGRMLKNRYKYSFTLQGTQVHKTSSEKSNPPHNITVVKGSAYGIFSKDFVEFLLNDQRAKDFLNWTRDILSPDEYYWATMNHNPDLHAPGSYNGTLL